MVSQVNYCGGRLGVLLDLEGVTQVQVAGLLGVSQGAVSKVIHGVSPLSEDLVVQLAAEFAVPLSFFARTPRASDAAAVTFRKKASTRAYEERRIGVLAQLAGDLWREASRESGYYTFTPPEVLDMDADDAASAVREAVGLGVDAPVPSMTRMLERMGVAVVANLDPQRSYGTTMAGVSCPSVSEDRPIVATLGPERGDVQRMTIAHELAHLLFDHDLATPPRARSPQERKAFDFAGALLLPAAPMRASINEKSTVIDYMRLKAQFGVSLMAIVKRAAMLHLISPMRAKSMYGQINARGWRLNEPVEVPVESPSLLAQAVNRAWPGTPLKRISEATGVPVALVNAWIGSDSTTVNQGQSADVIDIATRRARRVTGAR
jgi:putative helix-turn-helix domain-containing protein